jgi:hypothetical protein
MKRKIMGTAVALLAIAALGAPSASAATEFGDTCVGNESTEEPATLFALSAAGNPLPLTAPTSGVITKWKVNSALPIPILAKLKVLRTNSASTVLILGEAPGTVIPGANAFDARVSVQAGDRVGIFGSGIGVGAPFCLPPEGPDNTIGAFLGDGGGPGTTVPFMQIPSSARVPIAALIEPDADGDGFGDETQDQCPQSAASQTTCPVVVAPVVTPVALSASSTVGKNLVRILMTSSAQVPVTVGGTVNLGKGKKASLSGGTQVVLPGTLSTFTLLFPQKLKEKLKGLSRKRFLWLNVVASAPNASGAASTTTLKVKLRGQAKPKGKAKAKGKAPAKKAK